MLLKGLQYLCLSKTFKKFIEAALHKIQVSFQRVIDSELGFRVCHVAHRWMLHISEILLSDTVIAVALAPEPLFQSRTERTKNALDCDGSVCSCCQKANPTFIASVDFALYNLISRDEDNSRELQVLAGGCSACYAPGPVALGKHELWGSLGAYLARVDGILCSIFMYSGLFSNLIFWIS